MPEGGALLGYGFRSAVASARGLSAFLDEEVFPLRLIDPYLYHLDMVVCPVSPETTLVCPEARDPGSIPQLQRRLGPTLLRITRDEAMAFSANVVRVGRTLVTGGLSPRLEALLQHRGFEVSVTPLHEIQRAGGSAACLVSQWHARDRFASREPAPQAGRMRPRGPSPTPSADCPTRWATVLRDERKNAPLLRA